MTITKTQAFAALITVALLFSVIVILFQGPNTVLGSTLQGNDYNATSTGSSVSAGASPVGGLVKTGAGALGTVVVTGANTGYINIYDATTTNVNNRTGNTATSSIYIGSLPASLVAGTYVFDVEFSTGLYLDLVTGTMPTTTVTYR